ncbi:MAG TPA: hypothetical protein VFB94_02670 [Acidimicrobiales bacterium]|nr:hypothetical protein [Acidimicrobiales bacterium]
MAGDERSHFESRLTLEVLAPDQQMARALLDELGRRRQALNVYRGQALSFAFTPHGRFRLDFLRMPASERSQVILPEADLLAIEDHTLIWVDADPAVTERRSRERVAAGEIDAEGYEGWMAEELPFLAEDRPWERADAMVSS